MKPPSPLRRRLLILAVLVALFTLTGFFILPPILKSQLEKRLSATLGRRVTVEKIRLNPYALTLTLENFAIQDQAGAALFVGWRKLHVNFDALGSLRGEWVLSEIALDGFDARIAVNRDQSLSFADILAKLTAPDPTKPASPATTTPAAPAKPPRPVRIVSLKVSEARLAFADASRAQPFATTLGPLTFALTEFRTVSEAGAPYRFEAVSESGERLVWSGTLQAEPLRSAGEFAVENLALPKYAPYYADRLQADLAEGKVSVRGHYEIDFAGDKRAMKLTGGAVQLRGIKLVERATKEIAFELSALDLSGLEADGVTQKARIGSLLLTGGHVRARREKDGSINWLAMLQPPPRTTAPAPVAPTVAAAPAAPAKPPEVTIGEVALKDFQVNVADLAAPRPVQHALTALQFSLKDVTLVAGALMPLQLGFALAPQGKVQLEGSVGLSPLVADLKLTLAGVELPPLTPYLEEFINARIAQGSVAATLAAQVALPVGQPPAATVSGDITVEKLSVLDAKSEELAGFGTLALRGLRATTAPELAVSLTEINVAAPYARVVVNADKSLNLASIARSAPAPTAGTTPPPATPAVPAPASVPAPAPKIEIGKITISDGDYRFTDRSLEPNVRMAINQFGGTIAGLSSSNMAKADVDLKATVDGAGPVAITGKLDALGTSKTVDLKIDFKNVDLLPLSPYSGKFAGFELARGKLLLDVKVLVDGKKIDATNVVTLNQFTFGAPVKSPDATGLPVRLGIALLKDMDGKIVIDVPIQGSTDDPNFRIGRVVLRVIINLLTKVATSPFALLGAAFGGGGDELAFQDFAAGESALTAGEIKKLQTLVQALNNRPGLSLNLEGSYDTAADAYALKRVKLADTVRRTVWETKRATDPNIAPPAQLVISAEERVAAIKKLFDGKFPPGSPQGTPVPPAPKPVAPPAPPPVGFFKRIVRTVTMQAKREERAAVQENTKLSAEHAQAVAAALAAGLPLEEMTGRLAETMTIDDNDLRALGQARAQQVRDYFITTGKIAAERLFLSKPGDDAAKPGKGPRVFLELQ